MVRAALVTELNGRFAIEDLVASTPRGREVMVKVEAAGLCHSDLNVATIDRGRALPLIAGHEIAGVVVETGPEVRHLRVGDHVVGTEVRLCGECRECLSGAPFRCLNPEAVERAADEPARFTRGGERVNTLGVSAFAEVSIAHENQFVRIPEDVPFPQAAILGCAVSTGVGAALNAAAVSPGESVVVFGLGGVGLNVVQGARLAGAERIIGVDLTPDKLELARRFGATDVLRADDETVEKVREITGGGARHSFEVTGARGPIAQAVAATGRGGTTYLIGIPRDRRPWEVDILSTLIAAQRRVQGVYMGSTDPRRDIPRFCEYYRQGRLNLDDLVSRCLDLEEINDGYRAQESGALGRSVITSFGSNAVNSSDDKSGGSPSFPG